MEKELETRVQQAKTPIPKRNGTNMSLPYYKKGKSNKVLFYKDGIMVQSALEYPHSNESGGSFNYAGFVGTLSVVLHGVRADPGPLGNEIGRPPHVAAGLARVQFS